MAQKPSRMSNDELMETLQKLADTCRDGEKGYAMAARAVENQELGVILDNYSQQRASFVSELEGEVRRLGGSPGRGGSALGAVHRGWMNVKGSSGGDQESSIISECERGEDGAVRDYRKALQRPLPSDIRTLIERQFAHVQDAHDHMRALERAYQHG